MWKRSELLDARVQKRSELEAIYAGAKAAKRVKLSDEEEAKAKEIDAEIVGINDCLRRLDEAEAEARAAGATAGGADPIKPTPASGDGRSVPTRIEVIANGNEDKPFRSMGEYFQAVRTSKLTGKRDSRFDVIIRAAEERAAATGFNITLPEDGGYMVQSDFAKQLLTSAEEASILFGYVQKLPLSQGAQLLKIPYVEDKDRSGGSVTGGFQWYSSSEAEAVNASRTSIKTMSLQLKKFQGICYATDEFLRNAAALAAFIQVGFRREFSRKMDRMILFGNGNDEPTGILTAANKALLTVPKKTGQTAGTLIYENVNKIDTYHDGGQSDGVAWLCGCDTHEVLGLMTMPVGTGGVPVYLPAGGIAGQRNGVLYGDPVIKSGLMRNLGTSGDIVKIDRRQYYWIDQGDIDFQSSVHVRFAEGETAFKFTYWGDGRPSQYDKLTEENGVQSSPYVALATRA